MPELVEHALWRAGWLRDGVLNMVSREPLHYIVEPARWAIRSVGEELLAELRRQRLLAGRLTTSDWGIPARAILHYGSWPLFRARRTTHPRQTIVSVWHIPEEGFTAAGLDGSQVLIHTASHATKQALAAYGIAETRIRVLPLGIDLAPFSSTTLPSKVSIRERLGIPADRLVVGSFQKDGVGWGGGNQPKLIKGPDILVAAVIQLAKQFPIHVLLAGPARGYVEQRLTDGAIPYTSLGYSPNQTVLVEAYRALDCYLITSRVEGGPRQLFEAWASGIPVVSTPVGIVPDSAQHGQTALITAQPAASLVAAEAAKLFENPYLQERLATQGEVAVKAFGWDALAPRYFNALYSHGETD